MSVIAILIEIIILYISFASRILNMAGPVLLERYHASMLLSAAGDALGFKNGGWEFCYDGKIIHEQLEKLGGLTKINVSCMPCFQHFSETR